LSLGLFLATPSGDANAEMFRCVSPDGRVTFTDNATACPRATKHETSDRLQTVPSESSSEGSSPATPESPRRPDPRSTLEEERVQKHHWQQKKHAAEEELRTLEERQERLARVVTGCNRGAEIITRDATGIKYQVSCDEIRHEHGQAKEKAAELRKYLAGGLRRECREAGCLPGWIR
jgi:hypothetical protein